MRKFILSNRLSKNITRLFLSIMFLALSTLSVLADNSTENKVIPETLRYHGMGNLIASGFITLDDGKCIYISSNTLTSVPDTSDTHPFKIMLPEVPKAYWLDKDVLKCILDDDIFMCIESKNLAPDENAELYKLTREEAIELLNKSNH